MPDRPARLRPEQNPAATGGHGHRSDRIGVDVGGQGDRGAMAGCGTPRAHHLVTVPSSGHPSHERSAAGRNLGTQTSHTHYGGGCNCAHDGPTAPSPELDNQHSGHHGKIVICSNVWPARFANRTDRIDRISSTSRIDPGHGHAGQQRRKR